MTAEEKRLSVRDAYRQLLGRNRYSQALREYCFTPWQDGHYYSDCSSSVCLSYAQAGLGFGLLNTVGLYASPRLKAVEADIREGVPTDPGRLRVGDLLLFAGSDPARAEWDYVGHVEMVGEIDGNRVVLYGHGSGTPSKKEMAAYCRSRKRARTSTRRGDKGLIRVLRFIADQGSGGECDVRRVQEALLALGYPLPRYGADGEYGPETEAALQAFRRDRGLDEGGGIDEDVLWALGLSGCLRVTGGSVYVRSEPRVHPGNELGVAHLGDALERRGPAKAGFHPVRFRGAEGWISQKWTRVEGRE